MARVDHLWDSPGLDISNKCNFYLQPPTGNNPAWDAFYSDSDRNHLILQYTVSKNHGVKAEPIRKLLKRLPETVQSLVRMVFVVPPSEYESFRYQPWLGTGGKVLTRIPSAMKKMEQYVMRLPLDIQAIGRQGGSSGGSSEETSGQNAQP